MTEKQIRVQARYWHLSARHDHETMLGLFKIERYSDSLFYGHIVLEKILKAFLVAESHRPAPPIHDLIILAELAGLRMNEQEIKLLKTISHFNIRTRYPDYKLEFYKICNRGYTLHYLNRLIAVYKKLCRQPKLKSSLDDSPDC
jgi:HEPN domain-containing protein